MDQEGPGIGVGAVVFRGPDVLVIQRGKSPFKGEWSIPGGGLHRGERLEDAVRREVMEETGISIRLGGLLGVFEAMPGEGGAARHVVMIDYWAEWVSGEPVAGDDAAAAEFVSLVEARSRIGWDLTRGAIEAAVKLRNRVTDRP